VAKADEKRTPVVWHAEAKLEGKSKLRTGEDQYRLMKISGEPMPAAKWLEAAVVRLKVAPDCPQSVTDAAHRLEAEMATAFLRRECDAAWGWGSIKNAMITFDWWPRKRPRPR
jgi:hypothetical protein